MCRGLHMLHMLSPVAKVIGVASWWCVDMGTNEVYCGWCAYLTGTILTRITQIIYLGRSQL